MSRSPCSAWRRASASARASSPASTANAAVRFGRFWLPSIISDSGVESPLAVGLFSAVSYLVAVVPMVLVAGHGDRTGERRWHTAVPCVLAGLALALIALSLDSTVLALLGLTLAAASVSSAQAAFWSLPSALLAGAGAAAGIALVNSVGNICGAVSRVGCRR